MLCKCLSNQHLSLNLLKAALTMLSVPSQCSDPVGNLQARPLCAVFVHILTTEPALDRTKYCTFLQPVNMLCGGLWPDSKGLQQQYWALGYRSPRKYSMLSVSSRNPASICDLAIQLSSWEIWLACVSKLMYVCFSVNHTHGGKINFCLCSHGFNINACLTKRWLKIT